MQSVLAYTAFFTAYQDGAIHWSIWCRAPRSKKNKFNQLLPHHYTHMTDWSWLITFFFLLVLYIIYLLYIKHHLVAEVQIQVSRKSSVVRLHTYSMTHGCLQWCLKEEGKPHKDWTFFFGHFIVWWNHKKQYFHRYAFFFTIVRFC